MASKIFDFIKTFFTHKGSTNENKQSDLNIRDLEKSSFSSEELKAFLVNLIYTCNKLSMLYTKHVTVVKIKNPGNNLPPSFDPLTVGDELFNLDSKLETEINIFTRVQRNNILENPFLFYKVKLKEYTDSTLGVNNIDNGNKEKYYTSTVIPAYNIVSESLKTIKNTALNILNDVYKHWN